MNKIAELFLIEKAAMIKIPVKVGDTILTGRFKNKKTVIKEIGKDDYDMPTINGRKVVTFRIFKGKTGPTKPIKVRIKNE